MTGRPEEWGDDDTGSRKQTPWPKEGALQIWVGPGLHSAEAEVAVAKGARGGGMLRL